MSIRAGLHCDSQPGLADANVIVAVGRSGIGRAVVA